MRTMFSSCCKNGTKMSDITLLMLGLDNAGKTSTVKNFFSEPVEDVVPTVGFSTVEMRYKKCKVTIYDLGGGSNIRSIWKNYYALVHGIIFVVDSSDTPRLDQTKDVIHNVLTDSRIAGKPVLLLVNKQDIDGALNEVELCTALDVETIINEQQCPTRVETSCAIGTLWKKKRKRLKDKGIDQGFQWLLGHITENFPTINDRVGREVAWQKEQEERDKQERLLRVQKIRQEREKKEALEKNSHGICPADDEDCGERELNPFRPISEYQVQKDKAERKASVGGPRIIHVTPAVSPEATSIPPDNDSLPSEQDDQKPLSGTEGDSSDTTIIIVHEQPHTIIQNGNLHEQPKVKKKKKKFTNRVGPGSTECPPKTAELPPLRWEANSGAITQDVWTIGDSETNPELDGCACEESPEKEEVQKFSCN